MLMSWIIRNAYAYCVTAFRYRCVEFLGNRFMPVSRIELNQRNASIQAKGPKKTILNLKD